MALSIGKSFDGVSGHQCTAMNTYKQLREFLFDILESIGQHGFTLGGIGGDIFLICLQQSNLFHWD